LGNTPKIATKHYLMTTDTDFARAIESASGDVQQVLQNCMPQPIARAKRRSKQSAAFPLFTGADDCTPSEVTPTGFEPVFRP